MQKTGLCTTCVKLESCIFVNEPPVLECEEFSCGNHAPRGSRQIKVKRNISCIVAADSE